VKDIQTLSPLSAAGRYLLTQGIHALLAAPLLIDYKLSGALVLSAEETDAFSVEHKALIGEVANSLAIALQNAQLHEAAQQELVMRKQAEEKLSLNSRRLEVLHKIDQSILVAQSTYEIAKIAVNYIQDLLPCIMAAILMYKGGNELTLLASLRDGTINTNIGKSYRTQLLGKEFESLKRGQLCVVEDVRLLDTLSSAVRNLLVSGLISYVGIPLISQGELVGVFYLGSDRPAAFSKEELEIAAEVATVLAIAIKQAELQEKVRDHIKNLEKRVAERTRELSTLYDVTAISSQRLNLQAILHDTLLRVLAALSCDRGAIQLWDDTDASWNIIAHPELPPDHKALINTDFSKRTPINWIFKHNQPLLAPDISANPQACHDNRLEGPYAYLGAPMRVDGQVVGVVSLYDAMGREFSAADVALLTAVADYLGVAVERNYLQKQAENVIRAKERKRIAREMHDAVTQSLYSLILFAGAAKEQLRNGELAVAYQHIQDLEGSARQALSEMRLLLYELQPKILEKDGLAAALEDRMNTVEKRVGLQANLLLEGEHKVSPDVEWELYSIVLEALNNTLRHAKATTVTVRVSAEDDRVEIEIKDDGQGFEPTAVARRGGMGLENIRQRVENLEGELAILSAPGQGTTIRVRVEWKGKEISR
jgi:signal transduction histidine kinase